MNRQSPVQPARRFLAAIALAQAALLVSAGTAPAQRSWDPPGMIPGGRAPAPETAKLLLRIQRLEGRIRTMTGEIEQLQHQMQQMQKRLQAFQKDVDFRFSDGAKSGKTGNPAQSQDNANSSGSPPDKPRKAVRLAAPERNPESGPPASTPRNTVPLKRPYVFDPTRNPGAPGAPRQLGSIHNQRSLPLRNAPRHGAALPRGPLPGADAEPGLPGPDTPLNLSRKEGTLPVATPGTRPSARPSARPSGAPGIRSASLPAPDTSPRQTYRAAVAALRNRHYIDAEKGFKSFLERFPNSTLTPSVRYNLGIVYASRSRHREAAEQFLTVSTKHRKSAHAPNSLYRLGLSLERLGASEQACASYAEVERRYPQSPKSLRARVERQMKKAKC